MRIILWGINYAPEPAGIGPYNTELCEHLAARGHDVTAVTAYPYYPQWRREPAERDAVAGGVRVIRCWCYVPKVVTTLRRIAHELSFGVFSLARLLFLPRAEVYVVISPPLLLGLGAWILTTVKRSRFVFHVQDLQPDAAVGLGMLRRGALVRALYGLERLAYARAAAVSGISGGMIAAFRWKGVAADRAILLPNWLRLPAVRADGPVDRDAARRRLGIAPGDLLAFYSGNLGRKQNLPILIEAAFLLQARPSPGSAAIRIVIAGDGAVRPELERHLRAHPGVNVRLLPLLSGERYEELLAAADLALITQAAGTGRFFLPSKLLSVLPAGLPVLAVADDDSELARAVREGDFGRTIQPGDAAGLALLLRRLALDRAPLAAWAANTGWVRQFSREAILPRFEQLLLGVGRGPAEAASDGKRSTLNV